MPHHSGLFGQGAHVIIEAILEDLSLKQATYAEIEAPCRTANPAHQQHVRHQHHPDQRGAEDQGPFHGDALLESAPFCSVCGSHPQGATHEDGPFETVYALMEKVGKVPVRVLKDVPGFLGNRLQHAMWREAISLCENGIASAEDIDKVVKYRFGSRMPFIGPLETADLAGLKLTQDIHHYLFPYLENAQPVSPLISKLVADGATGVKAGKGFYEWTPEKVKQLIQKRDTVLLSILRGFIGVNWFRAGVAEPQVVRQALRVWGMSEIPVFFLHGLGYAGLLFLVSAGLTLVFGMMNVLNFAHAAMYMLGAYFSSSMLMPTGQFWLCLMVCPHCFSSSARSSSAFSCAGSTPTGTCTSSS